MGKIFQPVVRAYPGKTTFKAMRSSAFWNRWKATQEKGAATTALPLVPVVQSSVITVPQPDVIQVQWDRPMMMGCDAKSQITLLADAVPVVIHSIEFQPSDKSIMSIVVGSPFVAGQVVTWEYAPGACMIQELALPQTEMDTQVYDVENHIVLLLRRWKDEGGEVWEDENSEEWST